jgi:hypothetical protein
MIAILFGAFDTIRGDRVTLDLDFKVHLEAVFTEHVETILNNQLTPRVLNITDQTLLGHRPWWLSSIKQLRDLLHVAPFVELNL